MISAHAREVTSAETADTSSAKTADMTSAKASHVASAEAAHVASAATSVAAAAAGLRTRGKKAAGKHGASQNHHHSTSHDILLWMGGNFRHSISSAPARASKAGAEVAMN
jgi:hypothetical protein